MLKIKDDKLKELKRFGFEPRYDTYSGEISYYEIPRTFYFRIEKRKTYKLKIFKKEKWIIDSSNIDDFENMDLLYDLIQAGLIEKV